MKNSGIPWIGDIPVSWDTKRIKTIFSERVELSEDGSEDLLSVSEYYGVDKRSSNIDDGEYISRSESLVGYKKCYEGDFVSNIMLAWKGSLGVAHQDGIVSPAYCVYKPSDKIYSQYYHYLFRTSLYTGRFRCYSKGIIDSRLRLYSPYFFDITAIIPPSSEQKIIADFLDRKCAEIDEMIALQETIIEELKAYKQSVITEVVTKGLDPNVEMKDSGIEWIGKIPEGWRVSRLKNVANRRVEKSEDLNLKYIGLEHLVGFSEEMVVTENVYDSDGTNVCYEGDVIFGKLRPYLGKAKVIKEHCCCSTEFLVLKDNDCPTYLRYLMLSEWFIEIVNASTYGTKMPRANADFILNISVPVPSVNEQKAISNYLDKKCSEIDSLISTKNSKIEELKEYKKSIIYEYTTGKKEING